MTAEGSRRRGRRAGPPAGGRRRNWPAGRPLRTGGGGRVRPEAQGRPQLQLVHRRRGRRLRRRGRGRHGAQRHRRGDRRRPGDRRPPGRDRHRVPLLVRRVGGGRPPLRRHAPARLADPAAAGHVRPDHPDGVRDGHLDPQPALAPARACCARRCSRQPRRKWPNWSTSAAAARRWAGTAPPSPAAWRWARRLPGSSSTASAVRPASSPSGAAASPLCLAGLVAAAAAPAAAAPSRRHGCRQTTIRRADLRGPPSRRAVGESGPEEPARRRSVVGC